MLDKFLGILVVILIAAAIIGSDMLPLWGDILLGIAAVVIIIRALK